VHAKTIKNYVESWHQGVVLIFTLCQWKVRSH